MSLGHDEPLSTGEFAALIARRQGMCVFSEWPHNDAQTLLQLNKKGRMGGGGEGGGGVESIAACERSSNYFNEPLFACE